MLYCLPEVCGDTFSVAPKKSCKAIGLSPSGRGRKTSATARCGEVNQVNQVAMLFFCQNSEEFSVKTKILSNIFSVKTLNLILGTISKTSQNVLSPNLLICSRPFHGFALLNFRSDRIGFQLHSQAGFNRSRGKGLVKPRQATKLGWLCPFAPGTSTRSWDQEEKAVQVLVCCCWKAVLVQRTKMMLGVTHQIPSVGSYIYIYTYAYIYIYIYIYRYIYICIYI